MSNVCAVPNNIGGPFSQTLFLGCSVSNFTCNLGWGGDQTTLSINLVEDKCAHTSAGLYGALDTLIENLANQPDNVEGGTAFRKRSDNAYVTEDPTKALHKNMAFQIKDINDQIDASNINNPNPNDRDTGKVAYAPNGAIYRWLGSDPGFIGATGNMFDPSGLDILGTPVQFRFKDFTFGGVVSSWRQTAAAVTTGLKQDANGATIIGVIENGNRAFDVELKSFATLLNGCQLIISHYAGSICSEIIGTANNPTGKNLAMPFPYRIDNSTATPTFYFNNYNVGIEQGNVPNVFNIYGYLEYLGYKQKVYGNAGVNDNGMRARFIYDTLIDILGPNSTSNTEARSPFSPYGGIVTRTIRSNDPNKPVQMPQEIQAVERGISGGDPLLLTYMGVCPTTTAIDTKIRPVLKLDISEVPRPPRWVRIQGPVISIMQFITECCDGAGFDFFLDFQYPTLAQLNAGVSGIIKVRTVSRRKQPRKNQIEALVDHYVGNGAVESFTKGKEFTESNTRTMYIGGRQKRLVQLKNTYLGHKQTAYIWNPYVDNNSVIPNTNGRFVNFDSINLSNPASSPNQLREPNLLSTRAYSLKYRGGAAVVSESQDFNTDAYFVGAADSNRIKRGNYYPSAYLGTAQGFIGGIGPANREMHNDTICMYFGVGANNLIRPVYFDKQMAQHQILFQTADIQNLTSLKLSQFNPFYGSPFSGDAPLEGSSVSPVFLVLENEIRAAGIGFVQWLDYCFSNVFITDIAALIYKGFRDQYGWGPKSVPLNPFSSYKDLFISTINDIMGTAQSKTVMVNGQPQRINMNDLQPIARSMYPELERIWRFFNNIATEYYGKQFMVRVPQLSWYRDLNYVLDENSERIQISSDENGDPIYALEGSGKIYANYMISTDGAWEEQGNFIDDTMVIGGANWSVLADDSGKTPCVLGYHANEHRDHYMLYARAAYLNGLANMARGSNPHTVYDYELLCWQTRDPQSNIENHYFSSIKHELPENEHGLFRYYSVQQNIVDPYGQPIPDNHRYKLYVKAAPDSDIQFLAPDSQQPRAIVKISSPVHIVSSKSDALALDNSLLTAMLQDAMLKIVRGSSIPSFLRNVIIATPFMDLGSANVFPDKTIMGGLGASPAMVFRTASLEQMAGSSAHRAISSFGLPSPIAVPGWRDLALTTEANNQPTLMSKAACPIFCALPIEYRDYIYGPWINHPGVIKQDIFPDITSSTAQGDAVENLVGGVKVVVDESLVPWNFGSMSILDDAVMLKIADEVNYQQVVEMGTVTIPGFDNYRLGDMLKFFGDNLDGPTINSIQVQIGEGGIKTTYNLRTYQRKLGLFNKENAERIKALGQESIRRNKEINTKLMQVVSKLQMGGGNVSIGIF